MFSRLFHCLLSVALFPSDTLGVASPTSEKENAEDLQAPGLYLMQ